MKTIPTDGRHAAPRKSGRLTAFTALLAVLLAATNLRAQTAPGATNPLLEATQRKADALLARPGLSAYRGWLKFLRFQAERESARASGTNDLFRTNVVRFADWVRRIETKPGVLGTLRGVQEWAYESPGQLYPAIDPGKIEPGRRYRVATFLGGVYSLGKTFKLTTQSFRMTDLEAADVLDRFLLSNE